MIYTAFSDGGCKGVLGGWGLYVETPDARHFSLLGNETPTTTNRMELTGPIVALSVIKPHHPVRIVSDSQYVILGITEWIYGWQARKWLTADLKPVRNRDLWEVLFEASRGRLIDWQWVRGHAGTVGNHEADRLATKARKQLEDPKPLPHKKTKFVYGA